MWPKVASGIDWYLAQNSTECFGILTLSYEDLPPHLKPCFLYFGAYPEDFEIPVRQLIRLWVAEGFLDQEINGSFDLEDMAEEYLLQLIDRSLIQLARWRTDGGVKSCRIHDLLRNLSISEARCEKFLLLDRNIDGPLAGAKVRRLSIHYGNGSLRYDFLSMYKLSRVRTLLSFGDRDNGIEDKLALYKDPFSRISKFCGSLRVLDIGSGRYHNFLPKVEKLVQLKYLRMNALRYKEIPPSMSELVNLQTLDMGDSYAPPFSADILEMQQQRHLLLSREFITNFYIPKDNCNSSMVNHRTLSAIDLHGRKEADILKMFPNLKKLKACSYDKDLELFEYISNLQCLQTLKILGKFQLTDPGALPLSLTKITLHVILLDTSAFAKPGGLPNLQVLKLRYASLVGSKLEYHSNQGQFPRLEVLQIHRLDIEWWSMESQGLQSLVYLSITKCDKLKAIPDQLKQLGTLRQLKVSDCNALGERQMIWESDPRCICS